MRKMPRPAGYHWDARDPVIHPDGRKGCRWCKRPVPTKRHRWCGDPECIRQWTMRTQPAVFRAVIWERDRGVCALCGFDTKTVDTGRILTQIRLSQAIDRKPRADWKSWDPAPDLDPAGRPYPAEHWLALLGPAYAWKIRAKLDPEKSPWEADHIVPVVDGGDFFDLGNVRTLDVLCHRIVSAASARQRAGRRRSLASMPTR